jgi:uncharacterized membrane protein
MMPKRLWRILSVIMIFAMVVMALVDTVALAQGKVTMSVRMSPSVIQPGEPFELIYNITNSMDKPVKVRIREELYNHVTNGKETTMLERSIAPGEKQEISSADEGEAYKAIDGYVTYLVEYQVEGQNEWAVLGEGVLDIFNIGFNVSYAASASRVKRGDEVEYAAVVESTSNVVLTDIAVVDSQFGELGRIPRLQPGEKKTVKRKFKLQDTTESYLILRYKDPLSVRGDVLQEFPDARVKVEVEKPQPVYSLEVQGSVDKQQITSAQEVTFTLKVKNTGNVTLQNIQCTDWKGKTFYEIVQLLPGQEATAIYKATIDSAGKYTITCSGVPEDGAQKVQAHYTVEISRVEAMVEIERRFEPQKAAPGDTVTLTYIIRNTGKVALKDVSVDEPELGNIASFDSLKPGDEEVVSVEKEMDDDGIISKTVLTAKDELTGAPYRYEADELLIPAQALDKAAHVSIDVEVDPPSLEKAGAVQVKCTIKNDGGVALKNIEVFIEDLVKERNIGMGSMLVLNPGEEQMFSLSYLSVEQTSSFVVVVKAEDEEGNDLEFRSQHFEVAVGVTDGAQNRHGSDSGKVTLLKVALTVVIFLIILTAGTLIYLVRDSLPFFRRRKSLKHRAAGGD